MKRFEKNQNCQSQAGGDTVDRNMRPPEAALYTGLSESTLAKLRMRHKRNAGPRHIKISGCVIYRRSDLDAWMDQYVVGELDDE